MAVEFQQARNARICPSLFRLTEGRRLMAVRHASEKNEAICRPDYIFHLTCFAGCLDGFGECQNAEHLGRSIARKGWIVVTGGGAGGLTGIVARAVNHHGGRVYGVSLAALDPRPHDFFTEFECYQEFDARQRRLFELGDAYLALPGGIDTLHQVLHACVLNLAGPLQKPVILVGDHFLKRCDLTALLRLDGASCDRVLLYKAKSVEEA